MIAPFDIIYQQEVNWIYNYVLKAQRVTCDRKSYILVRDSIYSTHLSSHCNLPAQIEQTQIKIIVIKHEDEFFFYLNMIPCDEIGSYFTCVYFSTNRKKTQTI